MKKQTSAILTPLLVLFAGTIFLTSEALAGKGPKPNICERSCWNARAPKSTATQMAALNRAVIHHTASSGHFNTGSLADSKANVRAVQNLHMDVNGWRDIGYHFLVDKLGNIFEGGKGSMNSLPRGIHDSVNHNSFGFCIMGYFHSPANQQPTLALRNSLYDVIAWRMPADWSPYGGTAYGANSNVGRVCGHRNVKATACPGDTMYNNYITGNLSGGEARNGINQRKNGANPPYKFDNDHEGWDDGTGITSPVHINNAEWPGVIRFDQTADNGWVRGPSSNFQGGRPESVNVRLYAKWGNSDKHSMRARWIIDGDNSWDNAKSSPRVHFNAQNEWVVLNFDVNGPTWNNEAIKRMRLQFDQVNKGTRWLIDRINVQEIPRYWFDNNKEGWTSGGGLGALSWVSSAEGANGVIKADQSSDWGFVTSPEISFRGGRNDRVTVKLNPKNTASNIHDAEIKWRTGAEDFYSADKTSELITFTAQNDWVVLTFDVGSNPKWEGKTIKRVRLRVDSTNKNATWLIDNLRITQDTQAN